MIKQGPEVARWMGGKKTKVKFLKTCIIRLLVASASTEYTEEEIFNLIPSDPDTPHQVP